MAVAVSKHLKNSRQLHFAVAVLASLAVAACSSDKPKDPAQEAAASEAPKFPVPAAAQRGTPDINTVPTTAPAPRSSADERAKTVEGLVADRENARHADQGARTMPVAVRPLSDAPPSPQPATPPKPEAARAAAVERLAVPPPSRPADAAEAAPPAPPPPAPAAVAGPGVAGPRQAQALPQGSSDNAPRGTIYATVAGFKSLSTFNAGSYRASQQLASMDMPSGALTPSDRSTLSSGALKQGELQAAVRVIGHGAGNVRTGQERATTVARELERLGVPSDRLYVGADEATGSTEVYLHY
jgi:outer membrane protein OmpA-like peptidoglycan-associated protein